MQLTGFNGRAVLVTGAAGGIGQALVAALRASGALVCATDREDALAASGVKDENNLISLPLDLTNGEGLEAVLDEAESRLGPIFMGVHAAAVLSTKSVVETTTEEWQRVMNINAGGTFHFLRILGGRVAGRGKGGSLVVIGSNAGGIPRQNMAAYAASKAAVAMLTRCAGLELAASGVRCNLVAPGSTLTPMQTGMWTGPEGTEKVIAGDLASFKTGIPLGKLASPQDIAQATMFLLSDQAGHITMADIYVDGGATLRA